MKIKEMVTMTMMALAVGPVAQAGQSPQRLTVYVRYPAAISYQALQAQALAKQIFAGIGIELDWRNGAPARNNLTRAIAIEVIDHAPFNSRPTTLAYAFPYEGVHVRVFYDRIASYPPNLRCWVLAQVMAHEIGHILEGVSRHSESGIMKGYWSADDYSRMRFEPITFAPEDVTLIDNGMMGRADRLAAALNGGP